MDTVKGFHAAFDVHGRGFWLFVIVKNGAPPTKTWWGGGDAK